MARRTSAIAIAVVASGTATNASIPWRTGYAPHIVYAVRSGALELVGEFETWR